MQSQRKAEVYKLCLRYLRQVEEKVSPQLDLKQNSFFLLQINMPEIKNTKSQLMRQTCEQDELPPLIGGPAARLNNQGLFFEQNLDL